jgi:hypothetical protein
MRQFLRTAALAVLCAVSLDAQDSSNSKPNAKPEDARATTVTGCLSGVGGLTYTLSNVTMPGGSTQRSEALPAVATSGTVAAYELSPKAGLDLAAYVGQKVEVTGVIMPAPTKSGDASTPRGAATKDAAASQATDATATTDQARSAGPRLSVTSIKTVAAACS